MRLFPVENEKGHGVSPAWILKEDLDNVTGCLLPLVVFEHFHHHPAAPSSAYKL